MGWSPEKRNHTWLGGEGNSAKQEDHQLPLGLFEGRLKQLKRDEVQGWSSALRSVLAQIKNISAKDLAKVGLGAGLLALAAGLSLRELPAKLAGAAGRKLFWEGVNGKFILVTLKRGLKKYKNK